MNEKITPTKEEREEIFKHWNSKKIVIHKFMSSDITSELNKAIRNYTIEYTKELIDLYAKILEPGVPEDDKKYFWSYKWNLFDFLVRGLKKFDGQEANNYLRKQKVDDKKSVLIKRK